MRPTPPLRVPASFAFPFEPYDIQRDFMRALFKALDGGKFGVFESPTGTGKSLGLICGALTWYRDKEKARRDHLEGEVRGKVGGEEVDDDGDDWIASAVKKKKEEELRADAKKELDFLKEQEERLLELKRHRKSVKRAEVTQNEREFEELFRDLKEVREAVRRELAVDASALKEGEEEVILDDYTSDGEDREDDKWKDEDEEKEDHCLRIYYCSRTHSQLSQFVKEVQKSPFGNDVRLVSLASRNMLCINDAVRHLGSNSLVNERCLEMQKKSSKSKKENAESKRKRGSGTCPFKKQGPIETLRDSALLQVLDIEQLVATGRKHKACPYYASRHAVADSQLVVLPYNTLLHKPTREAVGIRLANSVVIVDEAHNLLDTLEHIHSVEVSGRHLCQAHSQLAQYKERYQSRLNAKNLLYIKQILDTLSRLLKVLGSKAGRDPDLPLETKKESAVALVDPMELMVEAEIYNLGIPNLIRYMQKSKIAQKLHGFAEKYQDTVSVHEPVKQKGAQAFIQSLKNKTSNVDSPPVQTKPASEDSRKNKVRSPLPIIAEFLQALSDPDPSAKAKVLKTAGATLGQSSLKYCLLNPASKFKDFVDQCHAIIVAGGTMQPVAEFENRLFASAGADPDRIVRFSCGHVVPKENLLPMVFGTGPASRTLNFSFEYRYQAQLLDELYGVLSNVARLTPGGVVVFFPSYEYEDRVFKHFSSKDFLVNLEKKKRVLREPKKSSELDGVLQEFSRSARVGNGAILLSVVGGKMSEGINFSDDLGRCVVMVGLPFPNSKSPELKEKMQFLDQSVGKDAGKEYYEDLCMKAVNQSIGRAIRHRGDYASILLVDQRYQKPSIQKKLPGWIRDQVVAPEKFPQALVAIKDFFRAKQQSSQ